MKTGNRFFFTEVCDGNRVACPKGDDAGSVVEYGLQLLKLHCRFIGSCDVVRTGRLGDERVTPAPVMGMISTILRTS